MPRDFSLPATNDPNYLGFSRQVDAPPPNKAWGTLFEGVGSLIGAGATALDTVNKQKIEDAVYAGVDKAQSPYTNLSDEEAASLQRMKIKGVSPELGGLGGGLPVGGAGGGGGGGTGSLSLGIAPQAEVTRELPPQVSQEMGNLERLAQGYTSGTVGQTYYQNQLLSTSKALRAQYPGYRGEIDKAFSRITGNIPANALLSQVFADFQAASSAQASDANKWKTEVHGWMKYLGPNGTERAFAAYGDARKMMEIRQYVATQEQAEWQEKRARETFDLKKLNREDTKLDAEELLRGNSNTLASKIVSGAIFGAGGMTMEGFQEKMFKYAQAGTVPEAELNNIKATVKDLSDRSSIAFDEMVRSDPRYRSVPATVIQQEKNNFMSYFKTLEDKVANKDFGIAAVAAQTLAQIKNTSGVDLSRKSEIFRMMMGMDTALGNSAGQWISGLIADNMNKGKALGADGKPMSAMGQLWKELMTDNTVKQSYGQGSLGDTVRNNKTTEKPPAAYLNQNINNIKKMISDPAAPVTLRLNAAKYLSQPGSTDFVLEFSRNQQSRVLGMLTAPEVTKGMADLRATDPAVWDNYKSWATQTLIASTKVNAGDLNNVLSNPALKAQWNTQTHQIDFIDPSTQKVPLISGGRPASVPYPEIQTLRQYNTTLKTIQEIYAKDGENITEKLLPSLSLPFKAPEKPVGASEGEKATTIPAITREPLSEAPKGTGGRPKVNAAHVSPAWGNPLDPSFTSQNLTKIQTGGGKEVTVNKYAAAAFQGFISELEGMGYKINDIGGYSFREKKGGGGISQHAFGNAIDINPSKNPWGSRKSDLPANVSDIAKKYGLSWGGDWNTTKDPMHFEYGGK